MNTNTPYPLFAAIDRQGSRLLTREQEHRLAVRAKDGDGRARGELVERNLRLVVKIAASFRNRAPGLELHDLVSEGVIGLMRAIEKFDPDSGHKLSTYATWWITQAICRAADRDGTVSVPADLRREVRSVEHHLADTLGREPSVNELHAELSRPMRERITVDDVAAARAGMHRASLDYTAQTKDGATDPLAALIADPSSPDPGEAVVEALDLRQQVADHTAGLAGQERALVRSRFGLDGAEPATLDQLAAESGTDTASMRRLERVVMEKMRAAAGVDERPSAVCTPAAAMLDLLHHGRPEMPARAGQAGLAAV